MITLLLGTCIIKNIDDNENIKHCIGLNHMVLVGY